MPHALPSTPTPRLQQLYAETVMPKLMKEFGLVNVNQVPTIEKVVINVGVGKQLENQKLKPEYRDTVIGTLKTISGQKPIMVLAKKSVSNFKVREGAPSGFMVTLRRERMWSFLDRFINLAFDKGGSYSCGLTEQSVWPEINMANVNFSHGMNINIVFRNSNPKMSRFALGELGMPFERRDENGKRIA